MFFIIQTLVMFEYIYRLNVYYHLPSLSMVGRDRSAELFWVGFVPIVVVYVGGKFVII